MSEFALDRVLRLTHGKGNGVDAACLMTASNMLIGRGADGDQNGCVCPIITAFIIPTNDDIPEALLGELYGPLLYEILGTRTDDFEVMKRRAYVFTDWSFRTALPLYLRVLGCEREAAALESLDEIVDHKTAALAALTARAALTDLTDLTDLTALAALTDLAARAARAALTDLTDLTDLAVRAVRAADIRSAQEKIWRSCPDVIRRAASIGDRRPVETSMTAAELCERLG
jgi:hypothetical protein